jgi:hypothetical protein
LAFYGDFDIDIDDVQSTDSQSLKSSTFAKARSQNFDPEQLGCGIFYTYAASYWIDHLQQCAPDALPDIDDISKLSRHGSLTLRNWVETYKRPSLTSLQRDPNVENSDELVVVAYYGSHALLAKFLERELDNYNIRDGSPATAVKWLMQSGDLVGVKLLLQNESLRKRLRNSTFLYDIITIWKAFNDHDSITSTTKATNEQWQELFRILARFLRQRCRFPRVGQYNPLPCSRERLLAHDTNTV